MIERGVVWLMNIRKGGEERIRGGGCMAILEGFYEGKEVVLLVMRNQTKGVGIE